MEDIQRMHTIEKVRKLLALSGSPNENEAMLAAEKAHALMLEYNISHEDVSGAERAATGFVTDRTTHTDSRPWRRSLGVMVSEMFFGKYWFLFDYERADRKNGYIRSDIHCFVGEPQNVAASVSMFRYFDETIKRLAREGSQAVPAKQRTSYQTSFMHACATRVCHRIRDRIDDAKRGGIVKTATGTTLPALASLYDRKLSAVDQHMQDTLPWYKEQKQKAKPRKARNIKINDPRGARDGAAAGDQISLDAQLARTRTSGLLRWFSHK